MEPIYYKGFVIEVWPIEDGTSIHITDNETEQVTRLYIRYKRDYGDALRFSKEYVDKLLSIV